MKGNAILPQGNIDEGSRVPAPLLAKANPKDWVVPLQHSQRGNGSQTGHVQGSMYTDPAGVAAYLKVVNCAEAMTLVFLINVSTRRHGLCFSCGTVDPLALRNVQRWGGSVAFCTLEPCNGRPRGYPVPAGSRALTKDDSACITTWHKRR